MELPQIVRNFAVYFNFMRWTHLDTSEFKEFIKTVLPKDYKDIVDYINQCIKEAKRNGYHDGVIEGFALGYKERNTQENINEF